MIINLYIVLIISSTGFKRKFIEDETYISDLIADYSTIDLFHNLSDPNISDTLIANTSLCSEKTYTKLGKYDNFSKDINKTDSNSQRNSFYELINEESNLIPFELQNYDEQDDKTDDEQPLSLDKIDDIVSERLKDFFSDSFDGYLDGIFKTSTSNNYSSLNDVKIGDATSNQFKDKTVKTRSCKTVKNLLNLKRNFSTDEAFMNSENFKLKLFIEKYISENLSDLFTNFYLKRVKSIEEACDIFRQYHADSMTYCYIFEDLSLDHVLKELLKYNETFDKNAKFNREICDNFSAILNHKIYYDLNSVLLREKMSTLSDDHKKLFFHTELMKIYKYVVDIPELLTLGGLFSKFTFPRVIFIMHLINLFAETVGNLKENRLLVLCLIYKAFDCFYSNLFNIFMIPYYEILCDKGLKHDLTYFIWEFDRFKYNISRRKDMSKGLPKDKIHLKTILLIYLYQHSLFIQYYNKNPESVSFYNEFTKKVIRSEECIGCLFNEYLNNLLVINKE